LDKTRGRLAQDLARLPQLAFSRSSALNRAAMSVGTLARLPASTSAFLILSFGVWVVQPIFSATDTIAAQQDVCSCS
jgi:hypothetical protein